MAKNDRTKPPTDQRAEHDEEDDGCDDDAHKLAAADRVRDTGGDGRRERDLYDLGRWEREGLRDGVLDVFRDGQTGAGEHDRGNRGTAVVRDEADPGREVHEGPAAIELLLWHRERGTSGIELGRLRGDHGQAVIDLLLLRC